MRPIRLAVIFDQKIRAGGGYQQALNAALLTRKISDDIAQVFFFTHLAENVTMLATYGIEAELISLSFVTKARSYIRNRIIGSRILKLLQRLRLLQRVEPSFPLEEYLFRRNIDLVYFLSPSVWGRNFERINYITTIWDLCHRDDPEFPEVRWNRELERRDDNYRAVLIRATAIFVDSGLGRSNVVHRYGIDAEKIHVMPFQAAITTRAHSESDSDSIVDIRKKYKLDIPYVFYPAHFWAHKNHVYLLEGLAALKLLHDIEIGAIFSGSDQGNLQYVKNRTRELGLDDCVRFLGFVANEEVPYLYSESIALVMPTYFGPTNLPPLEAFELGVPVLYSDKAGLRDQVGDAGLLMDLTNPESMANHIKTLIEDSRRRDRLIQAGYAQLEYLNAVDRVGVLHNVLNEFRCRRSCWGRDN